MTAKFTPSYAGLGELLRSAFMEAEMRARAEKVLAVAEATAPISEADTDGEYYHEHFKIETTRAGGIHKDRAAAYVINDHSAAFQIEYGTGSNGSRPQGGHSPRFRTLGRAADAGRT